MYGISRAFYNDFKTHFESEMIKTFLKSKKMNQKFSFSKSFKNIEMIEIKNRFLKSILKKKIIKWNIALIFAIMQFNNRIIYHFEMNFSIIFLKKIFNMTFIDFVLFHVSEQIIQSWFVEVSNSESHSVFLFRYLIYRVQIRNHIKQFFDEKKKKISFNIIKKFSDQFLFQKTWFFYIKRILKS